MDNKILEKNIEVLKKYYPEIAKKIIVEEENIPDRVFVDKSIDGEYIAGVVVEGRDWYLNSRYNPKKASSDWANQYKDINFQSLFVIMGFANGMYARELLKRVEKTNKILIYEPDGELFNIIIRYVDITDIIEDSRIYLSVKGMNDRILSEVILMYIDYSNMHILKYDTLPNYEKLYLNDWHCVVEKVKERARMIVMNRNTQISFKFEMIENTFTNYRDMICQYTINQIKEKVSDVDFDNIPAIVVSAGPSLDKNVDELKTAKGKAFIIAVDTALNTLASHNIVPDMTITIDPHKPISLFQSEMMKNVPIVVSQYSNSEVIEMLISKRFYIGEMDYMADVYMKHGKEMAALVETGGSVANNAFSFVQYLGFKKIILVGQDLAYTGNKVHTSSAYNDVNNEVTNMKNKEMVDAVGGGKVLTSNVMRSYNTWFESQIARYPYLEVVNATEGGAIKRGSIEMTLKDAIEKYCQKEYDFAKRIDTIEPIFTLEEQNEIYEELGNLPKNISEVKDKIADGIDVYDKFLKLYKEKKTESRQYAKILKKVEEINNYTATNPVLKLADLYNAQENYEVQAEVYNMKEDELEEMEMIHSLGVKMLKSYDDALEEMKKDLKYLTIPSLPRKFGESLRYVLRYIDAASYEYRRQNRYNASKELRNFTNRIKYIITLYSFREKELSDNGIKINVVELLHILDLYNKAMQNKDYILATDILQYNIKPVCIDIMSQMILNNLMAEDDNERENMTLVKAMDSELYSYLEDPGIKGGNYVTEFTSYGYTTLRTDNDNIFYFHSNQNPKLEARMQLDAMNMEYDNLAIVGLGLGYVAEEVIESNISENVLVFETDINIIRQALKIMNLRKIYSKCKFKIVYDPMLKKFSDYIKNNDVDIFFHHPSIMNIKNDNIRRIVEETEISINSVREQKAMLKTNLKNNLKKVGDTLDSEKTKINGKTVICVAGGASLDDDIIELKNKGESDDIIIIAVGTVYKKLRKEGIIPEYVLITDAKETMKNQIMDVETTKTRLLYLSTVHRAVIDSWKGDKSIVFQQGIDESELYALKNNFVTVPTGGSVSTTAISIAVAMGAKRVVCVGLDLAFVGEYTHAAGTNAKKIDSSADLRMVKSVSGKEIPTYVNLDNYRHWIERYIKDIDGVEFINCSKGAYIDGMKHVGLADI